MNLPKFFAWRRKQRRRSADQLTVFSSQIGIGTLLQGELNGKGSYHIQGEVVGDGDIEGAALCSKSEGRIEALFTLYFLGLLVQALMERELRLAMKQHRLNELPLYPEQHNCRRPTTEQVLRLFSLAQRHQLTQDGHTVQLFEAELTHLQCQVLALLAVTQSAYRARA